MSKYKITVEILEPPQIDSNYNSKYTSKTIYEQMLDTINLQAVINAVNYIPQGYPVPKDTK